MWMVSKALHTFSLFFDELLQKRLLGSLTYGTGYTENGCWQGKLYSFGNAGMYIGLMCRNRKQNQEVCLELGVIR